MLDYDQTYTVDGWRGIAWHVYPRMIADTFDDGEPTGYEYPDEQFVIAVMIGDDHKFVVDKDDLTVLDELDYCAECGQIGCTHDGRER